MASPGQRLATRTIKVNLGLWGPSKVGSSMAISYPRQFGDGSRFWISSKPLVPSGCAQNARAKGRDSGLGSRGRNGIRGSRLDVCGSGFGVRGSRRRSRVGFAFFCESRNPNPESRSFCDSRLPTPDSRHRRPPLVLLRHHVLFGNRGQRLGDLAVELLDFLLLFRSGQFQHRRGVSRLAVEAAFGDGVEEGEHAIEILLLDRVVLVIVAAGASDGQAKPGGAGG